MRYAMATSTSCSCSRGGSKVMASLRPSWVCVAVRPLHVTESIASDLASSVIVGTWPRMAARRMVAVAEAFGTFMSGIVSSILRCLWSTRRWGG